VRAPAGWTRHFAKAKTIPTGTFCASGGVILDIEVISIFDL
jgi:hypothetical protein